MGLTGLTDQVKNHSFSLTIKIVKILVILITWTSSLIRIELTGLTDHVKNHRFSLTPQSIPSNL